MISPQIQLFNAVFNLSLGHKYQTVDYDAVGDEGLSYPFVHVAEFISDDQITNKDVITGQLSQTIHVWALATDRGAFSNMVFKLEQSLRKLSRLENYYVKLTALNSNSIIDSSTNDRLLHGIIQAEFKLT